MLWRPALGVDSRPGVHGMQGSEVKASVLVWRPEPVLGTRQLDSCFIDECLCTRTCGVRGGQRLGAALCCLEVLSKHLLIISCLASPAVCPGEPWFMWGRGC